MYIPVGSPSHDATDRHRKVALSTMILVFLLHLKPFYSLMVKLLPITSPSKTSSNSNPNMDPNKHLASAPDHQFRHVGFLQLGLLQTLT